MEGTGGSTQRRAPAPWRPWVLALLAVVATFALRWALDPMLGARAPFLLFTLPVLAAAIAGGTAVGMGAAAAAFLLATWSFVPPRGSLVLTAPDALLEAAIFLTASAAVSVLAGRLREARLRAEASQAELGQRLAQLDSIYRGAPVGLSYQDAALRFVEVNDALAAINGRPAASHVGRTTRDLLPETADDIEPLQRQVLSTGRPMLGLEITTRTAANGGGARDFLVSYLPVPGRDARPVGFTTAVLDITDLKAKTREALEGGRRLAVATEAAGFGTYEWEVNGDRHVWSAETFRIFGLPEGAPLSIATVSDLTHPEDRDRLAADVAQAFARGDNIANEYRIVRPDGDVRHLVNRARVSYAGEGDARRPVRLIGAVRDATRERRAEEEVRRLNRDLEALVAERTAELEAANAQLEAFAYTVSHDLRAPLRSMEGFARILLDDYGGELGPKGRRHAERIVAAAERMDGLIRDLLVFSRLQRVEVVLRTIDPSRIVSSAVEEARAAAEGAEIEVAKPLPPVVAEPVILGQVLTNLLTNAVKFRKKGERAQVRVRGERRGERVRLWVEDKGIGIAPNHQHRIFGAFERLHGQEAFPGTGIGLAIVKAGAERMGGTAGVESELGVGARFWVELAGPRPAPGRPRDPADLGAGARSAEGEGT